MREASRIIERLTTTDDTPGARWRWLILAGVEVFAGSAAACEIANGIDLIDMFKFPIDAPASQTLRSAVEFLSAG